MELLVVLAVIAVLAVLMVGSIRRVMAWSRSAKCVSNLRQIGIAAQAWSSDNDGKIVAVYEQYEGTRNWTFNLAPYLGNTSFENSSPMPVYQCPEATAAIYSYGYNYQYLSWLWKSGSLERWVRYSQVDDSARTVMLTDSCVVVDEKKWKPYVRTPSGVKDVVVDFRHPGRTANVLWLDGHVSAEDANGNFMNTDDRLWKAHKNQ